MITKVSMRIVNKSSNPNPEYQTMGSSGMDLLASNEELITLEPMQRTLIPTGIFIEIPVGYEGQVRARSGLAIKHGITLINSVGTIDSDYRGELKVPLVNLGDQPFEIRKGDRIAQLIIAKYDTVVWNNVDELSDTTRGEGGFGSTGVKGA